MKNIIAIFLFVVTWSEHELKCANCGSPFTLQNYPYDDQKIYTVETVEHSIKLKTEKDVYLFIDGVESSVDLTNQKNRHIGGLLPAAAFNIQTREEERP